MIFTNNTNKNLIGNDVIKRPSFAWRLGTFLYILQSLRTADRYTDICKVTKLGKYTVYKYLVNAQELGIIYKDYTKHGVPIYVVKLGKYDGLTFTVGKKMRPLTGDLKITEDKITFTINLKKV